MPQPLENDTVGRSLLGAGVGAVSGAAVAHWRQALGLDHTFAGKIIDQVSIPFGEPVAVGFTGLIGAFAGAVLIPVLLAILKPLKRY